MQKDARDAGNSGPTPTQQKPRDTGRESLFAKNAATRESRSKSTRRENSDIPAKCKEAKCEYCGIKVYIRKMKGGASVLFTQNKEVWFVSMHSKKGETLKNFIAKNGCVNKGYEVDKKITPEFGFLSSGHPEHLCSFMKASGLEYVDL